ncbi:hypothetical protein [Bradyrhizobium sp. USDA 10063]
MEIEAKFFTSCDVASDGGLILLGFVDSNGQPVTVRLSVDQASVLIMTLPDLIDKALQTRYADATLRYSHELASWKLEQSSEANKSLLTLRTADGFGVCFSIRREQRSLLSEALATRSPLVVFRPN